MSPTRQALLGWLAYVASTTFAAAAMAGEPPAWERPKMPAWESATRQPPPSDPTPAPDVPLPPGCNCSNCRWQRGTPDQCRCGEPQWRTGANGLRWRPCQPGEAGNAILGSDGRVYPLSSGHAAPQSTIMPQAAPPVSFAPPSFQMAPVAFGGGSCGPRG